MPLRIRFKGDEYWLIADSLDEAGPLAYLHHCDDEGQVQPEYIFALSYAYYWPEWGVLRFNLRIGSRDDLHVITDAERLN